MSSTILITGGAGFIGSNFIHYWLEQYPEDKIVNLDALTYAGNLENLKDVETQPNYKFVHGNITDAKLVDKLTKDVDKIIHFAAETHVDRSILNPSVFVETNLIGTQVLLNAALNNRVKHFHHISTDEVFGSLELNDETQFSESTPYDPRSPYSASKAGADHLVRAYGETYGLPFTITNCSNNYGPFIHPEKFIPMSITQLIEGKKILVYGTGLQVRDWLYVRDHCRAIDLVVHEAKPSSTYLVGGLTDDISNLEIAEMIGKLMKANDPIEFVQDRPGHDQRYSVDWTKINHDLGWKPSVSIEEGLEITVEWFKTHQDWWKKLKKEGEEFFSKNYKKVKS